MGSRAKASTPAQEATAAEVQTASAQADRYLVTALNNLRLRPAPGTGGQEVRILPYRTVVTAAGTRTEAEGEQWLPVQTAAGVHGYVMARYLQKLES